MQESDLMEFMILLMEHGTDVWKDSGITAIIIGSVIAGIGVIWKYITSQAEKTEKFFLDQIDKIRDEKIYIAEKLRETILKTEELQDKILSIREENIAKLEIANKKLQEANQLLANSRDNSN